MHYIIKKAFLAAALTAFSLSAAFPALAGEPVGKDVTVVGEDGMAAPDPVAEQEDSDSAAAQENSDSAAAQEDSDSAAAQENPDSAAAQESSGGQASRQVKDDVSSAEAYVDQGPGAEVKEEEPAEPGKVSLGRFSITGYCGCEQCSQGHNLTYSGTVPMPDHTISADLGKFSIGTELEIDGIIYTVEDKGSSVSGNLIDIYYSSHEEALAKGTYTAEVYLIQD